MNMDYCLLCRKTGNERIGYIRVNSSQWQKENMKSIIEKHLWPMDTKSSTAKLCLHCWQQIKNFHSFYTIIAKAHALLGTITNASNVKEPMQNTDERKKEHIAINKGTDILKEQLPSIGYMIEHKNSALKEDLNEILFNQLSHRKRLRSGCPPKGMTSDFEISTEENIPLHDLETYKRTRKNPNKNTRQEQDEMIACGLCKLPLDNFIELRKHFRRVHNKRGFMVCCKKKFFNRPTLDDHLKLHKDPNFFKCKLCGKVYSDRSTLEKHTKNHLNSKNGKNHTCNECDKPYARSTQLENHKLTHAPDYGKNFMCDECGKSFTTSYNLNYHIQAIHRNKYAKVCDACGKTVRNSFKLHMETHNSKLATHIHCDICGLRLSDNRTLQQHKNSQHPVDGKKEYSCHKCSKVSPNPRALRTHERLAHETDYIHKCKMCDKAFKKTESLKDHTATHTGTPSYTRPWGQKSFMSNGNMYNHRKNAHSKKWEDLQRKKHSYTVYNVGNCVMSL